MKVSHPRRLNVAEAEANKASARQSPPRRVAPREQREQHRRSRNMVARQHDDQARSQAQGKVSRDRIRHRVTTNVSDSARRRLWPQVNMDNAAEVSRLDFVNRSLRHPVEDHLRMKRAVKEKECRALTLSRHHRRRSSGSRRSSEAARLPQPIRARDTGSRKVERRDNQKKRHRQVSNNFSAINTSGSGTRKLRSRFF